MSDTRRARDEWIALRCQLGEPAACVWFLFGGIELLKHFINRSRVEQLKELKRVELEILELRELLQTRSAG